MLNFLKKKDMFVKEIASLSIAALFTKIIGVIYKIPISYILDNEGMGYYNIAYTVFSFFYILSVSGIPKGITIVFSDNSADKNEDYHALNYVFRFFIFIGFIIFLTFLLLSPIFSKMLGSHNSLYSMLAIAPSILFTLLCGVLRGYMTSKSNLLPIALSQIIEAASKLVFGLFFALIGVKLDLSLPLISSFSILGITIGSFLSLLYLYVIYLRRYCNNNIRQKEKSRRNKKDESKVFLKQIISIAIPITLSSSILSFTNIIDLGTIIRGLKRIGYSEAMATSIYGNYSTLAVPMLNLVVSLLSPISVAILPKLVKLFKEKKIDEFTLTLSNSIKVTNTLSVAFSFSFIYYAFYLLDILFESSASAMGYRGLVFITPAMILLPLLTIINTALESVGNIKSTIISLIIGAVFKLITTYILLNYTGAGILSAAIGTNISYLVSLIISLYELKKVKINPLSLTNSFLPIIIAIVVFPCLNYFFYFDLCIDKGILSLLTIFLSVSFFFVMNLIINMLINRKKKVILYKNNDELLSN